MQSCEPGLTRARFNAKQIKSCEENAYAGGHNVIGGLLDCLVQRHPGSRLFGFRNGPKGIITQQYKEITVEDMVRSSSFFHVMCNPPGLPHPHPWFLSFLVRLLPPPHGVWLRNALWIIHCQLHKKSDVEDMVRPS
jgi:hypothetical protein